MPFLHLPLARMNANPSPAIDLSSISLTSAVVDIAQPAMCWPPVAPWPLKLILVLWVNHSPGTSELPELLKKNVQNPIRNLHFHWQKPWFLADGSLKSSHFSTFNSTWSYQLMVLGQIRGSQVLNHPTISCIKNTLPTQAIWSCCLTPWILYLLMPKKILVPQIVFEPCQS